MMTAPICAVSRDERRQALVVAERLLRAHWPERMCKGSLLTCTGQQPVIYAREASGAVQVTHALTGELIAQSLPALLTVLDPVLFPHALHQDEDEAFHKVAECIGPRSVLLALAEVCERPSSHRLSAPELAYVLRTWAEQMNDD